MQHYSHILVDLLVRLTDDTDSYFLYNLAISEEDFQSLKVQQGLLVDFASFPQKFIDLLNQCISDQDEEYPRSWICDMSVSAPVVISIIPVLDHSPAHLNVVETNAFKHLTHLSLKLLHGTEIEIKKYLAICLSCVKRRAENWTSCGQSGPAKQPVCLHSQDLTGEREKALENEQLRRELEGAHMKSTQQLQSRLAELEASNMDLTEKRYKTESTIRDLKAKLVGLEEEFQRVKQQALSLLRENGALDTECNDRERQVNQLQTRVAVLEQEIKDKDQLVLRTKEVLEATQQQKANGIIKKLQGDLRGLVGKIKVKNTVTVSQEKVLQETQERLHKVQRDLQDTQQQLKHRDEEVSKLKEQLEATVKKLDESREVLKTNENVIIWLNKQLNENQLSRKPETLGTLTTPPALSASAGQRTGGASHMLSMSWYMVQFNPMSAKPGVSPVDSSPTAQHPPQPSNKENGVPAGLES
ncbi:unnamed protein product, partial [Coregonus sp. 'balchen']